MKLVMNTKEGAISQKPRCSENSEEQHSENQYWLELCHSFQQCSDCGNKCGVCEGVKKPLQSSAMKTALLKSSTGDTIAKRNEQMEQWAEHYQDLYLRENLVTEVAINSTPQLTRHGGA